MYHLKCDVCRIRVRAEQRQAGEVGELCPGCGSLLEPVQRLSELLGLQERKRDDSDWFDDGGRVTPEAVAKALAPPRAQ